MTSARTRAPARILIEEGRLKQRIADLGAELGTVYGGAAGDVVMVGVLKGSAFFLADLVRAAAIPALVDFIAISAYVDSAAHSGVVRLVKDLDRDISDMHVVLVEDIVDTGLTLNYLRRSLSQRRPRSLATVALLNKRARRIVPVPLEFEGFEIPDVFVVGYGLDFQGRYRNLRDIYAVSDLARLANDPRLLDRAVWPSS